MIKNFDTKSVVQARVTKSFNNFFFAQNGEPRHIMCHISDGGALSVTRGGQVVLSPNQCKVPKTDEEIVLIRVSNRPGTREFTKASRWAPASQWLAVQRALDTRTKYRAIAYNHRVNGKFQGNTGKQEELVSWSTANELNIAYPRGDKNDRFAPKRKVTIGSGKSHMTLTCETRWERLNPDGTIVECSDPRL
jgi:hypothetical protein